MRSLVVLAALALVAGCKQPADLEEVEADIKELRSELREVREELRALRAETRELRGRIDAIGGEGAVAEAGAGSVDAGAGEPPTLPDGGAPPPPQSNVKISIQSNPSGATVFHEDRKLGLTPLLYQARPGTGQLMIRIEKPGYRPRLLSIRPDEDAKISVQLAKQ